MSTFKHHSCFNLLSKELLFWRKPDFGFGFLSCLVLFFLRWGLSVKPWLSWNSVCRPGWPLSQRFSSLCLPSAGIKVVHYHTEARIWVFEAKAQIVAQAGLELIMQPKLTSDLIIFLFNLSSAGIKGDSHCTQPHL